MATSKTIRASVNDQPKRRFIQHVIITTVSSDNKVVDERVADLMHVGTSNWYFRKHLPWALLNGHMVETKTATQEQVGEYIKAGAEALQRKFA